MSTTITSSSLFYHQMLLSVSVWWTLVCSVSRRPLYDVAEGSVITVPSWISKRILLLFQQNRSIMFYLETIGISLACCFSEQITIRIVAAILFTLYHLTEQSETNRHGEFPILYTMWTMCLPNEELQQACAWGIVIHFVLSAGYQKISVGGMGGRHNNNVVDDTIKKVTSSTTLSWPYPLWIHPSTMETYLTCYRNSKATISRPMFPVWNERIRNSKTLCSTISILTLAVECILIPSTLLFPPEQRLLGCHVMIGMHIGITLIMSIKVGIVFATTLPVYYFGFQCSSTMGSTPWWVAVFLGIGPTLFSIIIFGSSNGIMPENWPLSPFPLFMWNGKTAQCLLKLLMTGNTRMVFATTNVASKFNLVGLRVLHQGETITTTSTTTHRLDENNDNNDNRDGGVLHDCIMRSLSFTVVQGNEPLIEAVNALHYDPDDDDDVLLYGTATRTLLHRTWAWLTLEKRLIEAHTGEDLTHVYLVRVDESLRVVEVLF